MEVLYFRACIASCFSVTLLAYAYAIILHPPSNSYTTTAAARNLVVLLLLVDTI
jgi:hypothetical protein